LESHRSPPFLGNNHVLFFVGKLLIHRIKAPQF
jgi:hypothetical protein